MYNNFIVTDTLANNKAYDGNTLKFGITVENTDYIVKLPKDSISSIYSEYIASRFIRGIGINAHEVWIGRYNNNLVNIIKDFTSKGVVLRAYKGTRQSSEGTDIENKKYTYKDILYLIDKHTKMNKKTKENVTKQFWQMFICDAILGNRDRHHGNWGYLYNKRLNEMSIAPIYDNGGSLFPDIDRVMHGFNAHSEKEFLFRRSDYFPASLLMIERPDGKTSRSNYYEILGDLRISRVLSNEVKWIINNVGLYGILKAISNAVDSIKEILPIEYQIFYKEIVCMRYLHLVERKSLELSYKIIKGERKYVKRSL